VAFFHGSGQDNCANDTAQQRDGALPRLSFIQIRPLAIQNRPLIEPLAFWLDASLG
jgi:hypothetical protein